MDKYNLKGFYKILGALLLGFLLSSFAADCQWNSLGYGMELQQYVDQRIAEMDEFHSEMYERYIKLEEELDKQSND